MPDTNPKIAELLADLQWDGYLGSTPDADHNRAIAVAFQRGCGYMIRSFPVLSNALSIFILDRKLFDWLKANDPKALQQAINAVEGYDPGAIVDKPWVQEFKARNHKLVVNGTSTVEFIDDDEGVRVSMDGPDDPNIGPPYLVFDIDAQDYISGPDGPYHKTYAEAAAKIAEIKGQTGGNIVRQHKSLRDFIAENRAEIDSAIDHTPEPLDDEERRLWVLNDEKLYNWARSEGVRE